MRSNSVAVVDIAGASTRRAFKKTVEETLPNLASEATTAILSILPGVLKPVVGRFATELTKAVLVALFQTEDSIAVLRHQTKALVEEPFRTGVEQLEIALGLPSDTPDRLAHRIDRFRNALNSLYRAAQLAEAERPLVDLFRGLTAMHIPGAEPESVLHFQNFQAACRTRALTLHEQAASLEVEVFNLERKAASIPSSNKYGMGGGLIGMSEAQDQLRKKVLEKDARDRRSAVQTARITEEELLETADQADVLIALIQTK